MREGKRIYSLVFLLLLTTAFLAANNVTPPKEQFGFNLGDDYSLANYQQLTEYWKKLAEQSDRMILEEIGTTAEGRPILMATITSPENHARLSHYKDIARRLALAKDLDESEAKSLAREGKAVVWIDGGLHATEVLGAQQLMELVYQMVSLDDEETLQILNDVILLAVCVNPDGMDLVADWYMRESDPLKRSSRDIPRLYQKFIGHDNNRDFYMVTQPETEAINRVLYREWFPQIAYNHHQTGPAGTVLFAPPFRDPFNYNLDPLMPVSLDLVGAAMHTRFVAEGKPGATMRSGASYSTWWNGGLRTTEYFHNIIGLLTETIGNPTPIEIPFILSRQLPQNDLPYPIAPQKWHFRQSIDYSISANRAVLGVASKYRQEFLQNIYTMGRNSIERGSRDYWTIDPARLDEVEEATRKEESTGDRSRSGGLPAKYYTEILQRPEARDPRGYILPSDQPDFLTAGKFLNTLIKNGISVLQATSAFEVAGKTYPAGSYVVKTDQAFRPHILDMFEPQHHPDDIPYPGGPPIPPYDSAGWTLAYQMGVEFDRILNGFEGPFSEITEVIQPSGGKLAAGKDAVGYLLSHQVNDSFVAVNRLLKEKQEVFWLQKPTTDANGSYAPGVMYIPRTATTEKLVQELAREHGLRFEGISRRPSGHALKLRPVRIALWDRYGGSIPSGWLRWIFEQYDFPFEVVFPQRLDSGNLRQDFDVLVFADGAIPEEDSTASRRFGASPKPEDIPAEFRDRLGEVSVERTVPQLRTFLEQGGTILTIGSSSVLAHHLGLPVVDPLMEQEPNKAPSRLGRESYYVPGSVLRIRVDNTHPLAYGLKKETDVYFNNNPVFGLEPNARLQGVEAVAWFDSAEPLRSGWAWGQNYLKGTAGVVEAAVGSGKLFLMGPEVTFRAQPHGTFKFVFNGIYYGQAEEVVLGEQ